MPQTQQTAADRTQHATERRNQTAIVEDGHATGASVTPGSAQGAGRRPDAAPFLHLDTTRSASRVGSLCSHATTPVIVMHKSVAVVFAVCLVAALVDCREEDSLAPKRFDYGFQKRSGPAEPVPQVTEADVINEVQRNLAKSMAYLDEVQNGGKFNEKRRNKFEFIRFGK